MKLWKCIQICTCLMVSALNYGGWRYRNEIGEKEEKQEYSHYVEGTTQLLEMHALTHCDSRHK